MVDGFQTNKSMALSFAPPMVVYDTKERFAPGLVTLQRQGSLNPKKGEVYVILNNNTGDIALMPKGTNKAPRQTLAVKAYTIDELEELAMASETNEEGSAESLFGALMLLRGRMEDGSPHFLFAETANTLVVAPAPAPNRPRLRNGGF